MRVQDGKGVGEICAVGGEDSDFDRVGAANDEN